MSQFIPNYLSPLDFKVVIKRLPNTEFFTQKTSIPSISSNAVVQPTRFNQVFHTGDSVTYSNLDLSFIVDEEMENFTEIFNWIIDLNFPQKHHQFKNIDDSEFGLYSDISVLIQNSKKNPNIEIVYKNCFPTSLSDIQLDVTNQDVIHPEATATFQYDSYEINRI